MNIKLIGREADCDLVLEHTDIGGVQARLELTADGHVYLMDANAGSNTYLNRNEQWVKIHKVRLCVADRIRFGEYEVPLPALIGVFGKRSDIRLGDENTARRRQQPVAGKDRSANSVTGGVSGPRRNPLTGKIEQN